jgi:FeS assembly SUF system regulator
MLRISKLTDHATRLMAHMARSPERQVSAQQLARELGLPLPTAAALLKKLGRDGLVVSMRGVGGGYRLAHAPKDISVARIIAAIEGPVALTECVLWNGKCAVEADCMTRNQWRLASNAVQAALEAVSLEDMAAPLPPIAAHSQDQARRSSAPDGCA